jgi:hypothetical protein
LLEATAGFADRGDAREHVREVAREIFRRAVVGDVRRARGEAGRRAVASRGVLEDPVLAADRVAAGDRSVPRAHVAGDDGDAQVGEAGRIHQALQEAREVSVQVVL